MKSIGISARWKIVRLIVVGTLIASGAGPAWAQGVVPGTGERIREVGDDFEDPQWEYIPSLPKSSTNIDGQSREPAGVSTNNRWYESTYRGQPDVIQRVATPPGGIPGSEGALLMRSVRTGVPHYYSYKVQQDDLLMNVGGTLGGYLPLEWNPSFVVRVYLPPFEEWENRTGSSFGIRADCVGTSWDTKKTGFFLFSSTRRVQTSEPYWPGFFIQFNNKADSQAEKDSAVILIRGDHNGHEITGPQITEPGWWTFGMSFTPDGRVHYYASPGVDDLTAADHITSQFPYGSRCQRLNTFFFNVVNHDNGRSWSTPWIIDDPAVYFIRR